MIDGGDGRRRAVRRFGLRIVPVGCPDVATSGSPYDGSVIVDLRWGLQTWRPPPRRRETVPLDPGTQLGRYRVFALVGAGAMGEVYRARDERLDRDVAIKVLPEEWSLDSERLRRFEQEARAAAALAHPSILGVHDFGEHEGRSFMVTELLEGESLRVLLREGPLPVGQAVDFAIQIARGLSAAHAKGIIHRDLKPDNVFITRDGHVKILDFGLAKLTALEEFGSDARASIPVTDASVLVGTPGYLAPEQLRSGTVDARSDLFAFGAILYEMVSGNRAFAGSSAGDRLAAVLRDEPSTLETRLGAIPRDVDRIFRRCLRKDPDDRYQSAQEVVAALEAVRAASRVGRSTRRRVAAAAIAVMVLAAIAFAVEHLARHDGASWWARGGPAPRARAAPHRSIAVLPFENLTGDGTQDWFAEGVTTDVITSLSGIGELERVIAWGSVKSFKGTSKPLGDIAATLHVGVLVTGTVRSAGVPIKLTVQLYDADADRLVWATTFERNDANVVALQRDVVYSVADQLGIRLTPRELARLAGVREVNAAAYAERHRGREDCNSGTPEGFDSGLAHYRRAVELDPGFAAAWAGYADCYAILGISGLDRPIAVFPKALAAAGRAVQLDEFSPEALASLGQAHLLWNWDPVAAQRQFERAVTLGPNSLAARIQHAYFLVTVGRYEEGLAEGRRAQELDPIDFGATFLVGWSAINAQRFDEAITELERAIALGPGAPFPHVQLAYAYTRKGQKAKALAEFETATTMSPPGTVLLYDSWLGPVYVLAGRRDEGLKLAEGWAKRAETGYIDGYSLAALYFALDEREKSVAWLQRAFSDRSPNMVGLEHDEWFAGLRSDPRVRELIRKVNFPL